MTEHHGVFPQDYAAIRALPGIGDYTAGAISSICFEEKTPAVDGNVLRVAARLCDYHGCTDDPKVKKAITSALAEMIPPGRNFTQALMELGATVCLPNGAPRCEGCPVGPHCLARKYGTIDDLPVRKPKKPRRQEDMTVFCSPVAAVWHCGGGRIPACWLGSMNSLICRAFSQLRKPSKPQKTGASPRTIWKSS